MNSVTKAPLSQLDSVQMWIEAEGKKSLAIFFSNSG